MVMFNKKSSINSSKKYEIRNIFQVAKIIY